MSQSSNLRNSIAPSSQKRLMMFSPSSSRRQTQQQRTSGLVLGGRFTTSRASCSGRRSTSMEIIFTITGHGRTRPLHINPRTGERRYREFLHPRSNPSRLSNVWDSPQRHCRFRSRHLFLDSGPFMLKKGAPVTSQELEMILGFFALFMTRLDSIGPLSQGYNEA